MLEFATTLVSDEPDRLEQAQELVRDYCRWHIAPNRPETVTLDGSGSAKLILPTLRLTAVTSITEDGTLIDPTEYTWAPNGVITRLCGWWCSKPQSVVVIFEHGYETVPPVVIGVTRAIAQRAVDNGSSVVRQQAGPFSTQYAGDGASLGMFESEKTQLGAYRLAPRP